MVFPSSRYGHHERHLGISVWYHLWTDPAYQNISQEDLGRLPWSMVLHNNLWGCVYPFYDPVQLFHLPGKRKFSRNATDKQLLTTYQDLGANFFTGLECKPNPVFIPHDYALPVTLPSWTHLPSHYSIAPVQFHVLVLATFASLIAPFGGFFASGLKRTFKIKDFGDSIPGHGGMTDRMDCQFIMGSIAFMYYSSFIAVHQASVGSIIESAITGLTPEEQMEVVKGLSRHLVNQDIISPKACTSLSLSLP